MRNIRESCKPMGIRLIAFPTETFRLGYVGEENRVNISDRAVDVLACLPAKIYEPAHEVCDE